MNLPTSETKPDGLSTLPPSQKNRIHLVIKNASQADLADYLQVLRHLSTPALNYYLLLLLSVVLMGIGIAVWNPLIIFLAVVSAPFLSPLVGLGLSPALPSLSHAIKSFLFFLLTAAAYFATGWVASRMAYFPSSSFFRPFALLVDSNPLEWFGVILAAGLTAYWFSSQNQMYRISSAVLAYLIFIPLAFSGWQTQITFSTNALSYLMLALSRSAIALVAIAFSLWLIKLSPRRVSGWVLMAIFTFAAIFLGSQSIAPEEVQAQTVPDPTRQAPIIIVDHPMLPPSPTIVVARPTPTQLPASTPRLPTATPLPAQSPTALPIPAWVSISNGLTIRQNPDSKSARLGYALDGEKLMILGEQAQNGTTLWEKIETQDGKIGWVVANFLSRAAPSK